MAPAAGNPVPKMCVAPTPFERRVVEGYVVERPVTVNSSEPNTIPQWAKYWLLGCKTAGDQLSVVGLQE